MSNILGAHQKAFMLFILYYGYTKPKSCKCWHEIIIFNLFIFTNIFPPNLTKCERKAPKFIYGDISSLKNNDSISLFFCCIIFLIVI